MKILWVSNGPHIKTAYGNNTRNIIQRLKSDHQFWVFALYGLPKFGTISFDGVPVLPARDDGFGRDILPLYVQRLNPDLVIAHFDSWATPWMPEICHQGKAKFFWYAPWDMEGITPPVVTAMEKADYVIPFCKFAQKWMRKSGLKNIGPIIPHGVDTGIFKPREKAPIRKGLGLKEDEFVILMVAANKDKELRKSFDIAFEAIKLFRDKTKAKIRIYIHSDFSSPAGADLNMLAKMFGLNDLTTYTDPYLLYTGLNDEQMATVYNTADVLLMISGREGFGVPIIEAAASGVPPIVTNFSSMADLGFPDLKVKVKAKRMTVLGGYTAIPDAQDAARKLELVYKKGYDQRLLRRAAMEYDWANVALKWRRFLDEVA